MGSDIRTLIILDTNKGRSTLCDAPRYDSFEFGREYVELKQFLIDNGLDEYVTLAITEMTLKELLSQKKRTYENDISIVESAMDRLRALENVDIPEIQLPTEDFDISAYLEEKVPRFLDSNKIQLLKIRDDKKGFVLDQLVHRVTQISPPFKVGKDKSCQGHGFKDAVIWETIKQNDLGAKYDKIILFTEDSDFEGCIREIENADLIIFKSTDTLIQELTSDYSKEILERKYNTIIDSEYFINNLKQEVAGEIGSTPDQITIIDLKVKIIEKNDELKKHFYELIEDEEYFEENIGLISKIRANNSEYMVSTLIELNTNEIEIIQIEGI